MKSAVNQGGCGRLVGKVRGTAERGLEVSRRG